jgi:ABC-type Fe3+-siderophore transport system permease subunit
MLGAIKGLWHSPTLMSGFALVFFLWVTQVGVVLFSPLFHGRRKYEYSIISLFAIIGATVGWFLGIVVSPRDGGQDQRFAMVGSAVATFFSGFLVSKLNATFDLLFDPKSSQVDMPDRATLLIRASFLVAWFMIALTITFLTRTQ